MRTGPGEYLEVLFLRTQCVDVFWRSVLETGGNREGLLLVRHRARDSSS